MPLANGPPLLVQPYHYEEGPTTIILLTINVQVLMVKTLDETSSNWTTSIQYKYTVLHTSSYTQGNQQPLETPNPAQ